MPRLLLSRRFAAEVSAMGSHWFNPAVYVETDDAGRFYRSQKATELLMVWPERGADWDEAFRTCAAALHGKKSADEARISFERAAGSGQPADLDDRWLVKLLRAIAPWNWQALAASNAYPRWFPVWAPSASGQLAGPLLFGVDCRARWRTRRRPIGWTGRQDC